ncbi:MAG: metallophosphoesterase [Labilithrix sp.]|nr:metallophosphoesterase [Labilithrix sp.]
MRRPRLGVGVGLVGALVGLEADAVAAGPITKGPWVQRVTSSSAVVRVEVDPPAAAAVEIGLGPTEGDSGQRVFTSDAPRALHTIVLDGLQPGTRYPYSVRVGATSKYAAFVTAPPDEGDAPFRFLVYGDNRTDDAAHAAVVRAMVPAATDFLVHTGDFVADGGSAAEWQTFFDIEAPLLGARCLFSCVGNHELTDGSGIAYARFFGPTDLPAVVDAGRAPTGRAPAALRPEHLNGTYRWGNTRFFFINGLVSYRGTVDRTWLETALTEADAEASLKWRVVVVHHGPWSSGPHGKNARLHDAGIIPLLKEHKVDLILSGHDHIYERGFADGLAYVVSGGGGAPVYPIKAPLPEARKLESVRHFVDVSVSGAAMQFVATRADGSTIERCALSKALGGWDCDGTGAVAPSPPPAPTSRCACDVVGATPWVGAAPLGGVALGAVVLAFVRRRRRTTP